MGGVEVLHLRDVLHIRRICPIRNPRHHPSLPRIHLLRNGLSQRRPSSSPGSSSSPTSPTPSAKTLIELSVITIILAFSLLTNPFSLISFLGLLSAWLFLYLIRPSNSPLISAPLVGLAIVCTHGAFRVPEDLFLELQEPAATGFLSFLAGDGKKIAGDGED
ncbi:hypothetical protein LguiA_017609 [Lonicera macranthoides]